MPLRPRRPPAPLFASSLVLGSFLLLFGQGVAAGQEPGSQGSGPVSGLTTSQAPVLLVPGWSDDAEPLEPLRARLVEAGWPPSRVVAIAFRNPVGSNKDHAGEIAAAVQALLLTTGASAVDIVAHSMGGLALRHYLLAGGGGVNTRRVVFLATPHRGTLAAYLAWGEGGRQMLPGSEFLIELNNRGSVPDTVRALSIRTPMDLRVIPTSSANLPGVANVEICCPSHEGLLDDDEAFLRIRNFLTQPALGGRE